MFLNYSLPVPAIFTPVATNSRVEIAPGMRIALDPGKGQIRATVQDHLVLDLDWSDPVPDWSELALVLAPEWRCCRQIFLRYRAAAEGPTIQLALRMGTDEGFIDHFSTVSHAPGAEPAEHVAEFTLPPRRTALAKWMDLHLFFGRTPGRIMFHGLSLTGLR